MKRVLLQLNQYRRAAIGFLATVLIGLSSCFGFWMPIANAAPSVGNGQPADETIDRAYSQFSQEAGLQEEIFQKRLQEGENPEKLRQPYKRIENFKGEEVPETSLVETAVSKARQLVKGSQDKAGE